MNSYRKLEIGTVNNNNNTAVSEKRKKKEVETLCKYTTFSTSKCGCFTEFDKLNSVLYCISVLYYSWTWKATVTLISL